MAAATPRRSARILHEHTPKMSERKKGLFQSGSEASRESLTKHRQLTVLESESESDEYDLGIMGALDASSCDENDSNSHRTPEKGVCLGTRSHTHKLLKENQDLKNFMKSPFTLKKYETRYSCPDKATGSLSTPATPHLHNHPKTPSSTHSCASVQTTSSTSSRARKSLASLIADTESCSSSLKDLTFDSDSGADSKENSPNKSVRRSSRRKKMTPKLQSFKGILAEQKRNSTPVKFTPLKEPIVSITKMDISTLMSPTQMYKTPHSTSESLISPPKLGPNRRSAIQIEESPESCSSEKSQKRLNFDSKTDNGPNSKHPRLETNLAPKARMSLFNCDRLKEILSTKSFYGKSNPVVNTTVATKISSAIEATHSHRRRLFPTSHSSHSSKRKRNPGQINSGVRHRIRKPKIHKNKLANYRVNGASNTSLQNSSLVSTAANTTINTSMKSQGNSMLSLNNSQELLNDKGDPFDKEKQTIDMLLSQWTEEEVPETELSFKCQQELPCFNKSVIEETDQIFKPVTAVPVASADSVPQDSDAVIVELGAQKDNPAMTDSKLNITDSKLNITDSKEVLGIHNSSDVVMLESGHRDSHGDVPKGFLPVEGGYILVEDGIAAESGAPAQEVVTDLDEIERELKMLDEQILQMAQSNNINPDALFAATETPLASAAAHELPTGATPDNAQKLFPIFSKPNPGTSTPTSKGTPSGKKPVLKTGRDQYVIDAGQKKFGATQCAECGVIYQIGDPQDEHDHLVHHNASDVLKFNGLKDECVVGRSQSARCIRIRGGEPGWKKVETLLERVVHPHLGYGASLPKEKVALYTAYIYIDKRQIVGCLIVEPRMRAHKLVPGQPDCCSVQDYPVKCGVSRLWTHKTYRRRGLASRMLDCARASFLYGAALPVSAVAFSAPTAAGKAFATSYCGTQNFYVYLD